MSNRFSIPTACVILAFSTSTFAGGNGANADRNTPVSYTLTSATCPNLPPNTTINGSGTQTSISTVKTDTGGVTTIVNTTHSTGTATDQHGNSYSWDYSNHFNLSNTAGAPDVYTGLMADHFSLAGNGPARLSNGFLAEIIQGPGPADFLAYPVNAYGDPIGFSPDPVVTHCDPL
jgi:hypothetical protein